MTQFSYNWPSWALVRITAGPDAHPVTRWRAIEIGGLCIALGLFTRFWAAAATIEMAVIVYHHLPKFGWAERGYEYPLNRARALGAAARTVPLL